ncbi:MAG: phage tail sheath subtilisin-like domain-containing protein [Gammaproteobacteria bacterium]|jgi:phage tail sheath protein FI
MGDYTAPGVYVEETPSGSAPIAGVGTSIGGFIGVADPTIGDGVEMPPIPGQFNPDTAGNPNPDDPILYTLVDAKDPVLITSWQQFTTKFGDFSDGNRVLAHAVFGFFNNGGTRCWVCRIESSNSTVLDMDTDDVTDCLTAFNAIDEITLVAVPGSSDSTIQTRLISHCENAGDRFAILDSPEEVGEFTVDAIQGTELGDSNYAALYFPWIYVYDPVSKDKAYLPPSGHMAGIYARVDAQRGVHKAPANEKIRGAVGLRYRLSRADQKGLNPDGINVIRQFDSNVIVWGARTLGGDDNLEWKYINIRRLFLYLRESIDEGTQWVVFEPNSQALWSKITRNVSAFLTVVWRSGALFGATPQEAFYVKCDAETNPPEVRDLGQVVTEIGVAVVKPAEFVIFRISQWAGPGG